MPNGQAEQPHGIHRVQFDPRINLGHILTTLTILGGLVVGWNSMDKRLTSVEGESTFMSKRQDAMDAAMLRQRDEVRTQITNLRTELRTDLRDISGKLDRVLERAE